MFTVKDGLSSSCSNYPTKECSMSSNMVFLRPGFSERGWKRIHWPRVMRIEGNRLQTCVQLTMLLETRHLPQHRFRLLSPRSGILEICVRWSETIVRNTSAWSSGFTMTFSGLDSLLPGIFSLRMFVQNPRLLLYSELDLSSLLSLLSLLFVYGFILLLFSRV